MENADRGEITQRVDKLSGDQRDVLRVIRSRYPDIVPTAKLSPVEGLIERFRSRKRITRVEVVGEVGDILQVSLGGIDLSTRLPPGVVFRGIRRIHYERKKNKFENYDFDDYDPNRGEVNLIVAHDDKTPCRSTIRTIKSSAASVLHEMGHAWDFYEHPEQYIRDIENGLPYNIARYMYIASDFLKNVFNSSLKLDGSNIPKWFDVNQVSSISSLQAALKTELDPVKQIMKDRFSISSKYIDESVLDEMIERNIREIFKSFDTSLNSPQSSSQMMFRDFQNIMRDEWYLREDNWKKYSRIRNNTVERAAWNWADQELMRLKKINRKIALWNGTPEGWKLYKEYCILSHDQLSQGDIGNEQLKQLKQILDSDVQFTRS